MHVVREKKSGQVLFIDYSSSGKPRAAKSVYPLFDPSKMELGWTRERHIPADFDIDEKGRIVPIPVERLVSEGRVTPAPDQKVVNGRIVGKSIAELVTGGLLSLEEVKKGYLERFSHEAFLFRQQLIPDYKLQNAALGVYDEQTAESFKRTIAAFRQEFYRLKEAVEKAASVAELEAIAPNFPAAPIP